MKVRHSQDAKARAIRLIPEYCGDRLRRERGAGLRAGESVQIRQPLKAASILLMAATALAMARREGANLADEGQT
jgi:hypothetical protein